MVFVYSREGSPEAKKLRTHLFWHVEGGEKFVAKRLKIHWFWYVKKRLVANMLKIQWFWHVRGSSCSKILENTMVFECWRDPVAKMLKQKWF